MSRKRNVKKKRHKSRCHWIDCSVTSRRANVVVVVAVYEKQIRCCIMSPRFDWQLWWPDESETVLRRFIRGLGRKPSGPGRASVHCVLPATPRCHVWRVHDNCCGDSGLRALPPPVPDRLAAEAAATAATGATPTATATAAQPSTDAAAAAAADAPIRLRSWRHPAHLQATTTIPDRWNDQPTAHRTHV